MDSIKTLRATETWQRAGAYSVRVQGMNRQHHISLQEEFDEHDGAESKYIVLLDDTVPSPKKQTKNAGKKPNEKNDKCYIKLLCVSAFIPRFA